MKYSSWNSHEIIPMKILGVSLDFHSACTLECAMKTSWICNCCIMKILWYSHEKLTNFDTLVKLQYTCSRMSNRVEHQHSLPFLHIILCPRNLPAPSNSNCVPFMCSCNMCSQLLHCTSTICYTTMSSTKISWKLFPIVSQKRCSISNIHYLI